MTRRALLLALAVVVTSACTTIPAGLRVSPPDDGVARGVARIVGRCECRFGIAALHIESGRRLGWNAGEAFEAASVIKLALLTEAAARVREGTLDLTARWTLTAKGKAAPSSFLLEFDDGLMPTERDLLYLMIGRSDNTAANHFLDTFGIAAVNRRMASLGFKAVELQGRIPDRDPEETQAERWRGLKLGSMTPDETAEIYRRAFTGTLLGGESDALITRILETQHQIDRIPRLLLDEPGAGWAGKSGTKRAVRNDSGVLTTRKGRFVLVTFADGISDKPGATIGVNKMMGEIAKTIVNGWSRTLPDVPKQVAKP